MSASWASDGWKAQCEEHNAEMWRRRGIVLRPPGLEVVVPALTTNAAVLFRFTGSCRVVGLQIITLGATGAELAALELAIEDSRRGPIITDGRNAIGSPALSMHGPGFRWYPLARVVRSDAKWNFVFKNTGVVQLSPIVLLRTVPWSPPQ